jgi:CRP-like cAMP-binding protein
VAKRAGPVKQGAPACGRCQGSRASRSAVRRWFLLEAAFAALRAVPRRYDSAVREADFFSGLAPATLQKVCEAYAVRTIEDGASFFRETEAAETVYLLAQGRVTMSQLSESGQQVTMRVIAAGQMFGGVAVLGPRGGYPAAAPAVGPATALAWRGPLLKELARHDPALGLISTRIMPYIPLAMCSATIGVAQ